LEKPEEEAEEAVPVAQNKRSGKRNRQKHTHTQHGKKCNKIGLKSAHGLSNRAKDQSQSQKRLPEP